MLSNVVTTHLYVLFWNFYYYVCVAKILVLFMLFLIFSTVLQIKLHVVFSIESVVTSIK